MDRKKFLKYFGLSSIFVGMFNRAFSLVIESDFDDEKCRLAWDSLCGDMAGKKPFEYVSPKEGIQNVLLYGDSISIGYTITVRNELLNKVNVFRLFRNGGSSNDFIPNIEKMRKAMFQPYLEEGWDFEWDLIHFNVGLHDLKYVVKGQLDKINGKQVSSVSKYKENLKSICDYLIQTYPKAILVFATTTPVPDGEPGRYEGDELKYNAAALKVIADYPQIKINDLYSFVKPNFAKWEIKPGNVHYNTTGQQEQGKEVARVILEYAKK